MEAASAVPITINNPVDHEVTTTAIVNFPVPLHLRNQIQYGGKYPRINVTNFRTGEVLEASMLSADTLPNLTSVERLHIFVTGTFAPGKSSDLYVTVDGTMEQQNSFTPIGVGVVGAATLDVELKDGTSHTIPLVAFDDSIVHTSTTKNFMEYVREVEISNGLWARIELRALKGEQGIRYRVFLQNRNLNKFHASWAKRPHVKHYITAAHITAPCDPSINTAVTIERGFNADAPATSAGPLHVALGAERGPLVIAAARGVASCQWLDGQQAIPDGGTYAPRHRGDPNQPLNDVGNPYLDHDPESLTHVTIPGGRSLVVRGMFGVSPGQAALNTTPVGFVSNLEWYKRHIVGELVPSYKDEPSDSTMRRADRLRRSPIDVTECTNASTIGRRAYPQHREIGGLYPGAIKTEDNPHYGYRDYGGHIWSGGFINASTYYNFGESVWLEHLRDPQHEMHEFTFHGAEHLECVYIGDWGMGQRHYGFPYEKGTNDYGVYSAPLPSHTWPGVLTHKWLWDRDTRAREILIEYGQKMVRDDHLNGDNVPLDWAQGTDKDPRDFGAQKPIHGVQHRDGQKGKKGWYGDWGIRFAGWSIDASVKLHVNMGIDLYDHTRGQLLNVIRVADEIWGSSGLIFSRSRRQQCWEDGEQPWQLFILWRAMARAVYYMGITDPEIIAYLHKACDLAKLMVAYGEEDPQTGETIPARPWPCVMPNGLGTTRRPGIEWPAFKAFDAWDDARVSGNTDMVNWRIFYEGWSLAKIERHAAYTQGYHKFADQVTMDTLVELTNQALESYEDLLLRTTGEVVPPDFAGINIDLMVQLVKNKSGLTVFRPATNYATLHSDFLAMMRLWFDRLDTDDYIDKLVSAWAWHHQDGEKVRSYSSPTDSPSHLGFRMAGYPSAEVKVLAPHLDATAALRWLKEHALSVNHSMLKLDYNPSPGPDTRQAVHSYGDHVIEQDQDTTDNYEDIPEVYGILTADLDID